MNNKNDDNINVGDIDNAPDTTGEESLPDGKEFDRLYSGFTRVSDENIKLIEENFALQKENKALQIKSDAADILNELIEPYARKSFRYMWIYSAIVGGFLFFSGFGIWGFSLPESVMGFLVGSTAVTVIGLVGMVLTGIFVGARK